LLAVGAGRSTPVAIPALTFAGTATGALHIGCDIRWADVRPDTLTMGRLPEGARIVIGVDLHGVPWPGMSAGWAGDVLADSCQALGTEHLPLGVTRAWSFSETKIAPAPDGGAITTDDGRLADRLRLLRNYGIAGGRGDGVVVWRDGHNWRPSELSMALAAAGLQSLEPRAARAAAAGTAIHAAADQLGLWRQRSPAARTAWHKVRLGGPPGLEKALNRHGVATHHWGTPLPWHPVMPARTQATPVADQAGAHFFLGTEHAPPWTWTDEELDQLAAVLPRALEEAAAA
jgi:dTDP-4-amino-4,6-dideoxygalactose transaminase